jgi:hypothetical protein
MSIKIVSNGTVQGTHVIDATTGRPLENVSSFMILMDAGGVSASIFFEHVPCEIVAEREDYEDAQARGKLLIPSLH